MATHRGTSPPPALAGSPGQLLREAAQCQQRGELGAAEALYRRVLTGHPHHAESLHSLGVVLYQQGRMEEAAAPMERSLKIEGGNAAWRSNLGLVLQSLGRLKEAADEYSRALALNPAQAEAWSNLGNGLHSQGKLEEAALHYERALALRPSFADAHLNLGVVRKAQGRLDDAVVCYRLGLSLAPGSASGHCNLGNALAALGKVEEAIGHYHQALALKPGYADAHFNLGIACVAAGRLEEAVAAYWKATRIDASHTQAYNNLGGVLTTLGRDTDAAAMYAQTLRIDRGNLEGRNNLGNALGSMGRFDEAVAQFEQVLSVDPVNLNTLNNLGVTLVAAGRVAEGLSCYDRALACQPEDANAHLNRATAYLVTGDLAAGWPEYEWRHRARPASAARSFPQLQWRGEPLAGARILLHAEQGLGDSLQLLRYAPLVQQAGGEVLLQLPTCLHRLAREIEGVSTVLPLNAEPMPEFDLHCPLMSLPLVFGTTLDAIPAEVPYLRVPEEERQAAATLEWPPEGVRVGLAWAGNPGHVHDRARSLHFAQLRPLLDIAGVHYYSLQTGAGAEQIAIASETSRVTDLAPILTNMADAAAKILQLDLMITADTALAHLSGALGIPTWVMVPFSPDWRWMRDRTDSPWYPTMRLFRQPRPGDWDAVVETICVSLADQRESESRTG